MPVEHRHKSECEEGSLPETLHRKPSDLGHMSIYKPIAPVAASFQLAVSQQTQSMA
jgi:hypothetical protein